MIQSTAGIYCCQLIIEEGTVVGKGWIWVETYIQASGSNIGTDQGTLLGIAEFKKRVGPLLLLLLPVEFQNR